MSKKKKGVRVCILGINIGYFNEMMKGSRER